MKNLRLRNINVCNTLTACELSFPKDETPIIIKIGNKNYRLIADKKTNGFIILYGKR